MTPQSPVVPGLEEHEVKIAEDQDEYGTLPALPLLAEGRVITRWRLSLKERLTALFNGNVYLHVWTFNGPLQPVLLEVTEPELTVSTEVPQP